MSKDNPPRRLRGALAAALGLAASTALVLAGCGSDAASTSSATSSSAARGSAAAAPSASEAVPAGTGAPSSAASTPAGEPNELAVAALDSGSSMSFQVTGTPHAGLVTITLTNKGKYAHELGISQMKPGVTLAQIKAALSSNAEDAEAKARALLVDPETELSGPAIVGPGLTERAVVPLTQGHYVITCFLPGPDGMPHVAMGMIDEFTVAAETSGQTLPADKGVITLRDDGITVPAGFGTGGLYRVTNAGKSPHDFSVARLKGAQLPAYFSCVAGSFAKGTPIDSCPGELQGGISYLAAGTTAYLELELTPGTYQYVSTQGEGKDMQAGLAGTFHVG